MVIAGINVCGVINAMSKYFLCTIALLAEL
jgi:hypothetical protein